MAKKKDKDQPLLTPDELELNIRNLLVLAARPHTGEIVIDSRKARKLLVFAQHLTAPLVEMVEEDALTFQELVFGLLASAYFAHVRYVMGLEKPPAPLKIIATEAECQELEKAVQENSTVSLPTNL